MAKFIFLINWTEEGVRKYKDTLERTKAVEELAQKLGGSMHTVYWTLGPYDLVALTEFPDDETATAFALDVSSRGNVRTTSMRAFDKDGMGEIMGKLG